MKMSFGLAALVGAVVLVGCGQQMSPVSPAPLSGGTSSVGSGASQAVPFQGQMEGTQSVTPGAPPLATVIGQATGTATLLGRFTLEFPHTVNFSTSSAVGTYTFTAGNGDMLTASFTGSAELGPVVHIVENAVITGGTGRFAGATGSFIARREVTQATGGVTGSVEGTISTPGQ